MLSLLIFLFILGLMVIVHEWGHFCAARRLGIRVEKFSLGFGPALLRRKKRGTEYSVNAVPLGGYVKLAGDSLEEYKGGKDEYLAQAPGRRFWVIILGPALNYLLGFLVFWIIYFSGYPMFTTKIGAVAEGFGAKQAGLAAGDRVIALDGERVAYWQDLQKIVQQKKGERVRVVFLRNNQEQQLDVPLKQQELADTLGQKRSVALLGISPSEEIIEVRYGPGRSFVLGLEKTWEITTITYKALLRMLTGRLSVRESVTGPLGIYLITAKAAQAGISVLLQLIAVLSISLCIFNLLPLPILDGGHIVLLAIEKVRGKYLSLRAEQLLTRIGMTVIITLAILVTYNDLARLWLKK
jgi:regulator of sigma E protease